MRTIKNKIISCGISCILLSCINSNMLAQSGVYVSSGSKIQNSIVWDNSDSLSTPGQAQISGDGAVSYSAIQGISTHSGEGNQILSESPFIGEGIALEPYGIRPGSQTINAGNNAFSDIQSTDAAGYDRLWNGKVDMGAYEYQFPRIIRIIAKDTSKQVGAIDPELVYTLSGDPALGADSLDVLLTRAEGEQVQEGGYSIDTLSVMILKKGSAFEVTHQYDIEFVKGIFMIKDKDTGIDQNESFISLHPTITTGMVYVKNSEGTGDINVEIFDTKGTLLLRQTNMNGDFSMNLSSVPEGILFVKLSSKNKSTTIKVIKR